MELGTVKGGLRNVLVEKRDRSSVEKVERAVVICRFLALFQREGVGLDSLIELVRSLWIDGLVVKFELVVNESGTDFLV